MLQRFNSNGNAERNAFKNSCCSFSSSSDIRIFFDFIQNEFDFLFGDAFSVGSKVYRYVLTLIHTNALICDSNFNLALRFFPIQNWDAELKFKQIRN